jgi:hypothetical protein
VREDSATTSPQAASRRAAIKRGAIEDVLTIPKQSFSIGNPLSFFSLYLRFFGIATVFSRRKLCFQRYNYDWALTAIKPRQNPSAPIDFLRHHVL